MDHLVKPSNAIHSLEIPYYEFEGWASDCPSTPNVPYISRFLPAPSWPGLPQEFGQLSKILDCLASGDAREINAARAFVQRSLFFEFLRHYLGLCGITFTDKDYIRRQNGLGYLSTARLTTDLSLWNSNFKQQNSQSLLSLARHHLTLLNDRLRSLEQYEEQLWGDSPAFLMLDRLSTALHIHFWQNHSERDTPQTESHNHYLHPRMIRDGPLLDSRFNHSKCTVGACVAYQINESNYEPLHAIDSCQCAMLEVNTAKLCVILEEGGVPVLECQVDYEGQIDLDKLHVEMVPVSNSTSYTAISHVWAHGAGNPRANAMYRCQVARILKLIRSIEPSTTDGEDKMRQYGGRITLRFWMDTLCVPVSPKGSRHQAILKMRDIYMAAAQVLTVDVGLMTMRQGSPLDILIRILTSAWASRLWTLQECVLSNNLIVAFGGRLIAMQEIENAVNQFRKSDAGILDPTAAGMRGLMKYLLWAHLDRKWQGGALFKLKGDAAQIHGPSILKLLRNSAMLFEEMWQQVSIRSTSKADDQYICIASILGVSLVLENMEAGQKFPPHATSTE